jgi:hypothetical protein
MLSRANITEVHNPVNARRVLLDAKSQFEVWVHGMDTNFERSDHSVSDDIINAHKECQVASFSSSIGKQWLSIFVVCNKIDKVLQDLGYGRIAHDATLVVRASLDR